MAMFVCSSESQLYSGHHQKQHGQQIEGGDSLPLLCFCEIPLRVLHLAQYKNDMYI